MFMFKSVMNPLMACELALAAVDFTIEEVSPEFWGCETDKAYTRFTYWSAVKGWLEEFKIQYSHDAG